jgi:uncharacterized protein (DUF1919 family)
MFFDKELARKNREIDQESWELLYGKIVSNEFRKIYSADKCEAVINNYLGDPYNAKYVEEFKRMQDYRRHCKAFAKNIMGF